MNRAFVVLLVAAVLISLALASINIVTPEAALERFKELSGSQDVTIVRHSNLSLILGSPRKGTFELNVDGKPASGSCESDLIGPLVCTYYPARLPAQ